MKKIVFLFCLSLVPTNGFADDFDSRSYSIEDTNRFQFNVNQSSKAEFVQNKRDIAIQYQRQNIQKITTLETGIDSSFYVQIEDFNFDGFTDVAISENGYSGGSWFYNIYFFSPNTKRFEKKMENIGTRGEIEIDKGQKEISGYYRSGQSIIGIVYRFQNGNPYIHIESDESQGSSLVAKTYKNTAGKIIKNIITDYDGNPVKAKVLLPKVSLYNSPDEASKTTSYLIKDDQVTLLAAAEGWRWLFIEYDGVKKIRKWAHANEFFSLAPETEIPGSYLNLQK